jgi:sugar O-acyltransferase (sialic acid O-acetyltransferase NeuD family)
MRKELIIFPFGGNGREALLSVLACNMLKKGWDVLGFIDDDKSTHGKECCGVKVLGGRDMLKRHPGSSVLAVPGSPESYLKRKSIIEGLLPERGRFATVIHPSAVIAPDAVIGSNTVIMANVVISCGVKIGENCVILPNTVISHDSIVGAYSCVGSNVTISGGDIIGSECYIGSGVRIRERIKVGDRSLAGMGANIVSDVGEGVVVVGNPARPIRKAAA